MHNEVLQTQVWCWRCCSLSFTLHERVSNATGSQRRFNKGVSLGRLTRPSKHRWNYYYYNSNGWRNKQYRLLLTALMRNWFLYSSVVIIIGVKNFTLRDDFVKKSVGGFYLVVFFRSLVWFFPLGFMSIKDLVTETTTSGNESARKIQT